MPSPSATETPACAADECLPQILWLLAAQATREATYTELVNAGGQVVLLRREYTDAGRAELLIGMTTLTLLLAGLTVLIITRRSK